MTPRRAAAGVVGLVGAVLPGLVTGCAGHASYCDTVRSHQSELGSATRNGDPAGALQVRSAFQDLQRAAPDDVQGDYQLVVTRITALRDALDRAGVDASSYDPKHPPPGLAPAERASIRRAAAGLAAADVAQALASVEQEVRDVCHTPLEL